MGDVTAVFTALGGLGGFISAVVGGIVLLRTAFGRTSPREREDAAREAIAELLTAAADGHITPEEWAKAAEKLRGDRR